MSATWTQNIQQFFFFMRIPRARELLGCYRHIKCRTDAPALAMDARRNIQDEVVFGAMKYLFTSTTLVWFNS